MRKGISFKRKRKRTTWRRNMEVMRKRRKSKVERMRRVREKEITLQSPTSTTSYRKAIIVA